MMRPGSVAGLVSILLLIGSPEVLATADSGAPAAQLEEAVNLGSIGWVDRVSAFQSVDAGAGRLYIPQTGRIGVPR